VPVKQVITGNIKGEITNKDILNRRDAENAEIKQRIKSFWSAFMATKGSERRKNRRKWFGKTNQKETGSKRESLKTYAHQFVLATPGGSFILDI